ncbi:hypothetical protein GWI33_001125 [Rhynchophorus ferrugineus]|uniref:Uncharacterized protein n=1 Tax=Rhynchophorus ferrugineus TaxID=354439 RepID=A0A834MGL5_RHYFE|nr:hypothetical protein GWI33_001125 [Rhynchophorus ferrugineus]
MTNYIFAGIRKHSSKKPGNVFSPVGIRETQGDLSKCGIQGSQYTAPLDITETIQNIKFLVDASAELSIIPRNNIRCVFKEEIQCTVAEQMYGTTLKLPGEMFRTTESKIEAEFVRKLKSTMRQLEPVEATNYAKEKLYVNTDLQELPFLFVRSYQSKISLSPLCEGPFRVLDRKLQN